MNLRIKRRSNKRKSTNY